MIKFLILQTTYPSSRLMSTTFFFNFLFFYLSFISSSVMGWSYCLSFVWLLFYLSPSFLRSWYCFLTITYSNFMSSSSLSTTSKFSWSSMSFTFQRYKPFRLFRCISYFTHLWFGFLLGLVLRSINLSTFISIHFTICFISFLLHSLPTEG